MKDDEPLQTSIHGRHAYALYLRRDLQRPVWYVRIKTQGRTRTIRRSTGCARFEDAKLKAAQIVAELESSLRQAPVIQRLRVLQLLAPPLRMTKSPQSRRCKTPWPCDGSSAPVSPRSRAVTR